MAFLLPLCKIGLALFTLGPAWNRKARLLASYSLQLELLSVVMRISDPVRGPCLDEARWLTFATLMFFGLMCAVIMLF